VGESIYNTREQPMKKDRLQYIIVVLITVTVYVTAAKIGLTLAFVAEQITVVWPPTGIALCAVLLFGYRIWPAIALGAFIANITTNTPATASLGIATGNTLEALVGAYLLNRFVRIQPALHRFRDIFGLIFFGAMVSTILSATIGVLSLCITEMQPWERFGPLMGNWILGDAMGDVIIAPVVLTLFAADSRRRVAERGLREFILLVLVLSVIDVYVFGQRSPLGAHYHPPDYAIFPVLIWAALRFGTCGTAICGFTTATIAVLGTIQGFGPFTAGDTNDNLISLELFMFVAAVTGLLMAVSETKRRMAEGLSHRSEERYRSLALASSQVVWSANSAGEVVEDLPTWRAFTGQTKEEMLGGGWMRKIHPEDIEHVVEVWQRSLANGTPHENEFRALAADGTYRNVFARAVPVLERDGRIREWVGTLTDVTEKKKAEHEIQQANRRKDEFLAMLAHELRNPLAPMRNAVQVLRIDPPRTQLQWARDVIYRQLQHITRLVDDLLDASRITQGKITLQREKVELAALVARAVETSRPLIEARRHQLTVKLPSEPIWLDGDPTRLAQVVANLLNNSAKYTEEAGQICLNGGIVGNEVVLRVRDTGVGIPANMLPHVFDLFTQADRSLDRSQGGLGIGLTLVRNLVELHGGRVEALSAGIAQGSEFVVYLRALTNASDAISVSPATIVPLAVGTATLRILVVDDNPDAAETLALLLQFGGHDVRTAHEGESALETAYAFRPQVIVLDIGLPKMDGYEVARRLRQDPEMKKLFLVALTGYGQDEDRQRSKDAGFDHHLVKPVDPAELQSVLTAIGPHASTCERKVWVQHDGCERDCNALEHKQPPVDAAIIDAQ
jgi:two-component system CheB/CheR fusion protein